MILEYTNGYAKNHHMKKEKSNANDIRQLPWKKKKLENSGKFNSIVYEVFHTIDKSFIVSLEGIAFPENTFVK